MLIVNILHYHMHFSVEMMARDIVSSIAIFLAICQVLPCFGERVVHTNVGSIKGALDSDGGYYKFLGIPYAQVDVENPFGAASRYPKFSDVFEANDDSKICPQVNNGEVSGTIDCLNLHVYVPSTATNNSLLPVLVWVHGGFFMMGNALESHVGPKFIVRHDVIMVALSYRIGIYGFMCLDIPDVPGNQGLKDQYLAMQWVKENIRAFGGDPDQITLAGNSAGAHSIDLHLLSDRDVLYNKVILQSGSSLATTVLYEADKEAPIRVAEKIGLNPSNLSNALSLLTNTDTSSVLRAAAELNIQFKPCAEKKFDDVDAFITNHWLRVEATKVSGIPILIGFTEYEGMRYHIDEDSDHFYNLDPFYTQLNQTFNFDSERMEKMEEYIRHFYLGDNVVSKDMVWQIINFESDYVYVYPIQRSIRKFLAGNAGNIFYYMFAYSGERNYHASGKSSHGAETRFLFDMKDLPEEISEEDQLMINRMTTMWSNFVKYGDPTPQTTDLLPIKWSPLTSDVYHYLRIDSQLTLERRPFNKRMAFLDLFYQLNDQYQRTFEKAPEPVNVVESGTAFDSASFLTLITAFVMILKTVL